MIEFKLTPEQHLIKKTTREFSRKHILPGVIERDEKSIFPNNEIKLMGELGYMGMMVPEIWNGSELDTISYVLAIEEIAAVELATLTNRPVRDGVQKAMVIRANCIASNTC